MSTTRPPISLIVSGGLLRGQAVPVAQKIHQKIDQTGDVLRRATRFVD